MEFLKYLDVLIGFAVIMVLLSPLVTGVTQFAMWIRGRRSAFLLQAVERLIAHLEPGDGVVIEPHDALGSPLRDVQIGGLGRSGADGRLVVPQGLVADPGCKKVVLSCPVLSGPPPSTIRVTFGGAPTNGDARSFEARRAVNVPVVDGQAVVQLPPPVLSTEHTQAVARAVVRHPMIARAPLPFTWPPIPPVRNRNAEVIEREELIRILLELAAGEQAAGRSLSADGRAALLEALALNGIADPTTTLRDVRTESQELEGKHPEAANHVRQTQAIVTRATSSFVGKMTQWFDAAMTRATQQYAAEARFWTIGAAAIVAFGLQIDAFALIERLTWDNNYRDALVGQGVSAQSDSSSDRDQNQSTTSVAASTPPSDTGRLSAGLALLPLSFRWELPTARITIDPRVVPPYPPALQLAVGGRTYDIIPRWLLDPAQELKAAIEASGAPVDVTLENTRPSILVTSEEPVALQASDPTAPGVAVTPVFERSEGTVRVEKLIGRSVQMLWDGAGSPASAPIALIATDGKEAPWQMFLDHFSSHAALVAECANNEGFRVTCEPGPPPVITIRATTPLVRNLRLTNDAGNPYVNLLDTGRYRYAWRVLYTDAKRLPDLIVWHGRRNVEKIKAGGMIERCVSSLPRATIVPVAPNIPARGPSVNAVARAAQPQTANKTTMPTRWCVQPNRADDALPTLRVETTEAGLADAAPDTPWKLTVATGHTSDMILRARAAGPLELRRTPGQSSSNILEQVDNLPQRDAQYSAHHLLGYALSWCLLSLGAPFWFDALKNLLKLRPAAATEEDKQRMTRTSSSATTPAPPSLAVPGSTSNAPVEAPPIPDRPVPAPPKK